MNFSKKPLWLIKILHFEYWSWWAFYLPLLPWYLLQAFRAQSFTFFTNVDTNIEYGGFFGESKIDILTQINKKYLPKTIFLTKNYSFLEVKKQVNENKILFPLIAKPNVGERGNNVERVNNENELEIYFNQLNDDFIIQELIDFEVELGVLYYRMPNAGQGKITSITQKEFLSVTGDGKLNILELMQLSERARFQIDAIKQKIGNEILLILPKGEIRILETIGNHCRGTKFLNKCQYINDELNKVFDTIAVPISGFHYGRFDLRVRSIADLYKGENIKIVELNGVSADPGHIYDPNYQLFKAYMEVAKHWKIIADVSILQSKNNILPIPIKTLWPIVKKHFFN